MENKSQYMEVNIEDMSNVLVALMKQGYHCKVWQDGESMSIVVIEYIHPEFEGINWVIEEI